MEMHTSYTKHFVISQTLAQSNNLYLIFYKHNLTTDMAFLSRYKELDVARIREMTKRFAKELCENGLNSLDALSMLSSAKPEDSFMRIYSFKKQLLNI